MYCTNCGKEIEDDALFCEFCGAKTEQKTDGESPDLNEASVNSEKKAEELKIISGDTENSYAGSMEKRKTPEKTETKEGSAGDEKFPEETESPAEGNPKGRIEGILSKITEDKEDDSIKEDEEFADPDEYEECDSDTEGDYLGSIFTFDMNAASRAASVSEGLEWIFLFIINVLSFALAAALNIRNVVINGIYTVVGYLNTFGSFKIRFNISTMQDGLFRIVFYRAVLAAVMILILIFAAVFVCSFLNKHPVKVINALNITAGASVYLSVAYILGGLLGLLSTVLYIVIMLTGVVLSALFLYKSIDKTFFAFKRRQNIIFTCGTAAVLAIICIITVMFLKKEILLIAELMR